MNDRHCQWVSLAKFINVLSYPTYSYHLFFAVLCISFRFVSIEMAEGWFLLMTDRQLFGMKLGGLMGLGQEEPLPVELGEDWHWESIDSPPFDFSVDLPVTDCLDLFVPHQYHFVFDSKLYVARGGLFNASDIEPFLGDEKKAKAPSDKKKKKISDSCVEAAAGGGRRRGGLITSGTSIDDIRECIARMPCCKIYQFDMHTKGVTWPGLHSVPPLPTPFAPCFLGNIIPSSGDVYCLVYNKSRRPRFEGFWVLGKAEGEQGQCQWERLPSPPPLNDPHFTYNCRSCFISQDKLFIQVDYSYQRKSALYSFDPRTAEWAPVDDHVMHSFDVLSSLNRRIISLCFPSVSMSLPVPGLIDCSIALHCNCILDRSGDDDELRVLICAMMLNNQNGAVSCWQLLDECFEGMETNYFGIDNAYISLADLGNGMVCALLYGYMLDHDNGDSAVLCMSVFTLTMAEEQHFADDIGTEEAPQKKQTRFLNVQVHVKRLFIMKDYEHLNFLHPFVFRPDKEDWIATLKHAYSKGGGHPLSGKYANKANKVSFSNRKTKKLQFANHPKKRIWWEARKHNVKRHLSRK